MPTDTTPPGGITPEQARTALAEAEEVRTSTTALSATPWPAWFAVCLTLYSAALPIAYGGVMADEDWLLPRPAWIGVLLLMVLLFTGLFAVAARNWRHRTGVALRLDVLPKRATVPLFIGLPAILIGSAVAFRTTGWPGWLVGAALLAGATSIGFHLAFVRLHRKSA
ncbi:hypothetical protein DY218_14800 [Streptomyces triticagri]|uniref:Uncharacterized protein n=1 Tax=Streptomyces triticagri TaxID=2293568 RepID=A0A372M5R2_9ACTN|nr:hypothetical protein [Streptomyces triticagri]RFU85960.1 hypothetical protein DY218_14800 [Streptomyces triticagri]